MLKIFCLGDVVGSEARDFIGKALKNFRAKHEIDLCIINAENSAGGVGVTAATMRELLNAGADLITLGDHTFQQREFREFLETSPMHVVRPANYPPGAPGRDFIIYEVKGVHVGLFNLLGRVFMNPGLDCPFRKADELIKDKLNSCPVILCDIHAEATSEKIALGRYLDGRISLLFGTHTHVQTADEQILAGGTGYISDLGMCGPQDGVIGMSYDVARERFMTGLPKAYKLARGKVVCCGIIVEVDEVSGKTTKIERVAISSKS